MGLLPSWLNPFDVVIVFALLGGAAWGFVRGLIRMAISLAVLYVAAVLGMTFYDNLGNLFRYMFGMPQTLSEGIAFLFILAGVSMLVNFILRRTYRDTELPAIRQIDQLGGMIIGFLLASLWIGFGIMVSSFILGTPTSEGSNFRLNLISLFRGSALIPIFYRFLPIALASLRPWMPKGLPPDIFAVRL